MSSANSPFKVIIRTASHRDVTDLHAIRTHPQVARTITTLPDDDISHTERRVVNRPNHTHLLVAEANGRVVGSVTLGQNTRPRMTHSGAIGLEVHPDYWGQGIGTLLMEAVLDLADNWLNLKRVELEVNTDNPAAIHLYEKLGFEHEGIKRMHVYGDGRWADSYLMARIRP